MHGLFSYKVRWLNIEACCRQPISNINYTLPYWPHKRALLIGASTPTARQELRFSNFIVASHTFMCTFSALSETSHKMKGLVCQTQNTHTPAIFDDVFLKTYLNKLSLVAASCRCQPMSVGDCSNYYHILKYLVMKCS